MLNLGTSLYDKLPEVYREYDALQSPTAYPLQRFYKVLGTGFDYLEGKINDYSNILDVDNCPKEYLLLLANLLGFEFPYSMDEATQRKFIKILPTLYKMKGTPISFEYLAKEIFGSTAVISVFKNTYTAGMPASEWRKVFVKVEFDGEALYLEGKEANFEKFVEMLRPVNCILVTDLSLFYLDDYNYYAKVSDSYPADYSITDTTTDNYLIDPTETILPELLTTPADLDTASSASRSDTDLSTNVFKTMTDDLDTLSKSNFNDTTETQSVTFTSPDTETYSVAIADTGTTTFLRAKPASLLSATTNKLVTSSRTTDYVPLNSSISY
jgi:phage tail-like protein